VRIVTFVVSGLAVVVTVVISGALFSEIGLIGEKVKSKNSLSESKIKKVILIKR
jgi:hypothetical protein